MTKYLITSPAYTGQAELYFSNAVLVKIDLTATNMEAEMVEKFKAFAPSEEKFIGKYSTTKATVVAADYTVSFEDFWLKYNHKINRKRCLQFWEKLSKTKQVQAFYGVDKYLKFLGKEGYRKQCDPENYLRNEMWENEWK